MILEDKFSEKPAEDVSAYEHLAEIVLLELQNISDAAVLAAYSRLGRHYD